MPKNKNKRKKQGKQQSTQEAGNTSVVTRNTVADSDAAQTFGELEALFKPFTDSSTGVVLRRLNIFGPPLSKGPVNHCNGKGSLLSAKMALVDCYALPSLLERGKYMLEHMRFRQLCILSDNLAYVSDIDIDQTFVLVNGLLDNQLNDLEKQLPLDVLHEIVSITENIICGLFFQHNANTKKQVAKEKTEEGKARQDKILEKLMQCYIEGKDSAGYDKQKAIYFYGGFMLRRMERFVECSHDQEEKKIEELDGLIVVMASLFNIIAPSSFLELSSTESKKAFLNVLTYMDAAYKNHFLHSDLSKQYARLKAYSAIWSGKKKNGQTTLDKAQLMKQRDLMVLYERRGQHHMYCQHLMVVFSGIDHTELSYRPTTADEQIRDKYNTLLKQYVDQQQAKASQFERVGHNLAMKVCDDLIAEEEIWKRQQQVEAEEKQALKQARRERVQQQRAVWQKEKEARRKAKKAIQVDNDSKTQQLVTSIAQKLESNDHFKKYFLEPASNVHNKEDLFRGFSQHAKQGCEGLKIEIQHFDVKLDEANSSAQYIISVMKKILHDERKKHELKKRYQQKVCAGLWKVALSHLGLAEYYFSSAAQHLKWCHKVLCLQYAQENYVVSLQCMQLLREIILPNTPEGTIQSCDTLDFLVKNQTIICDMLHDDLTRLAQKIDRRLSRLLVKRAEAKARLGDAWYANKSPDQCSQSTWNLQDLQKLRGQVQAVLDKLEPVTAGTVYGNEFSPP